MAKSTSKPFGFISYNTYDFLKGILQKLISDGEFNRCACWYHESLGEDKNHFHCWIEPADTVYPNQLKMLFDEVDENGNHSSIAIKPQSGSKFNDAYLYGIHDSDYLASKNKVREVVNIVSDKHIYLGDFKEDIREAQFYLIDKCLAPYLRIKRLVEQGLTLEEIYIRLRTPFAQLNSVRNAYYALRREVNAKSKILEEVSDKSPFDDDKEFDYEEHLKKKKEEQQKQIEKERAIKANEWKNKN